MASKGFKLTDNQKFAAYTLHTYGNVHNHNWNTVQSLINKGLVETFESDTIMNRFDLVRFTPEGQAWADAEFGTPDPTPTPDNTPTSTPETVQAESAPVATDNPVSIETEHEGGVTLDSDYVVSAENDPVMTEIHDAIRASLPVADKHMSKLNSDENFIRAIQNWNVNLNAIGAISTYPPVASDPDVAALPVADADLPFASGLDDSELAAESLQGHDNIWHKLNTTTRKPANGHGRTSRNRTKTARRREFSKPMAKVTLANMQRRKTQHTQKSRPVKSAIQIADVLRSMGIGKAA